MNNLVRATAVYGCIAAVSAAVAVTDSSLATSQLASSGTCCAALSALLPNKVFTSSSASYASSLASYWSYQEQHVAPKCIVIPEKIEDVQTTVFVLSTAANLGVKNCQLAVRSGGHTPQAGWANIENGITLDLSKFNEVTVSKDKTQVALGPGNRWVDVYSKLDQLGVATTGGRVASVGVGGLILGGGISFFSGRFGFVADNVVSFQVVLASGQAVTVSSTSNPDLFKALKGGSNNFGVVTQITTKLFKQGSFWGGFVGNLITDREKQFQFFEKFANSATYDPYSALIVSYSWTPAGGWINANNFEYTKAVPSFNNVSAFSQFNSLPTTFSTMRLANLTSFTQELEGSNPAGSNKLFVTLSFKNSAKMISTFYNLSEAAVPNLPADSGIQFSISFQPIPQTIISKGAGSNSLGLDSSDGDLVNVLLTLQWVDPKNSDSVTSVAKTLFSKAGAAAQSLGVANPYLYLNYAASWQDPIASYGASSVNYLKSISKKYDRNAFFQKQVPGGFKLHL